MKKFEVENISLGYEAPDQNEKYRLFLMQMEVEEQQKREQQLRLEIEEQGRLRNFEAEQKLKAEREKILKKLQREGAVLKMMQGDNTQISKEFLIDVQKH